VGKGHSESHYPAPIPLPACYKLLLQLRDARTTYPLETAYFIDMVRVKELEPSLPYGKQILS
jgi:hypothetical protein